MHFAQGYLLVCHFEALLSALLEHLHTHIDSMTTQRFLSVELRVVWAAVVHRLVRSYRIQAFMKNFPLVVRVS